MKNFVLNKSHVSKKVLFNEDERTPLPISAFRPAFEIAKFNDGTEDISIAVWVFKVKELDIAVAHRFREIV